jgi:hypothetical protein
MYLEDGKCAHCGKIIAQSTKFAPHNTELNSYAIHTYRPYFCTSEHIDDAVNSHLAKDRDYTREIARSKEKEADEQKRFDNYERTLRKECDDTRKDNDAEVAKHIDFWKEARNDPAKQNDKSQAWYSDQISDWVGIGLTKNTNAELIRDGLWQKAHLDHLVTNNKIIKDRETFQQQHANKAKAHLFVAYQIARNDWENANAPPPPPTIADDIKFEHTLCLAASGGGKTTLMYHEIIENLKRPEPAAMVIIDPKGTVVQELSRLACFDPVTGRHKDRLIIIDPSDYKGPPAFNVFKPANEERYNRYDSATREFLETQIIELLAYTFSSRKQPLTGKQAPCFENVCRLILRLPNPDLSLLLDVLNDQQSERKQSFEQCKIEWREAIYRMPAFSTRFFKEQYYTNYTSSRDEIATRLYGTVGNPAIQKVFGASHNKFDMFDALQTGKLVVVNVPLAFLGDQGTELFGRYMIAATLAAALERVTIPKHQRKSAFLYIDEFQLFADDDKTTKLLGLAREFSVGVTMFTHILDHFSIVMRAAVLTNTRTKYAARLKNDAATMARAMGDCDPALLSVSPTDTHVQLAWYVDGKMDVPVIMQYPRGAITKEPKMDNERHNLLLERNRQRVSSPTQSRPQSKAPPAMASQPDQYHTNPAPPQSQPRTAPAAPSPTTPPMPNDTTKLRDRTGALDWELTINPRIAEAGGEIPLVVHRTGQPVKINVKIPPLTRDNTVFRLAGLGYFRQDKTRGDLYLTIKVPAYPEQNTDWADKW